jgi:hypothetical protein
MPRTCGNEVASFAARGQDAAMVTRSPALRAAWSAVLVAALSVAAPVAAQQVVPRADYGAFLEPKDRILHGGGQDAAGFAQYWQVMGAGARPAFLMHYLQLRTVREGSLAGLASELAGYERDGVHLVVQIGLAMTQDGTPSSHYEGKVAAGELDFNIDALCEELELLGHPVLLRIGYEFNGTAWNGYKPKTYVEAFRRITAKLRARKLEVATVWDAAGELDFLPGLMDYYPGDEFVDWWGINLFSGPKGSDASAFLFSKPIARFLDAAEQHRKPVLIGEATPRYTGVGAGQKSWDRWFGELFELIARRPGIKALSYINWDWSRYPQWGDWGDARLERDPVVAGRFRAVVSGPTYLSGGPEPVVRAALRLAPREPRAAAPAASAPAADSAAAPAAGSAPVERLVNGGFEAGAQGWEVELYQGGAGKLDLERDSPLAGSASGALAIRRGGGTNWFVQLVQPLTVRAGKRYRLTATLRGSKPGMNVDVWLQQTHEPYGGAHKSVVVGPEGLTLQGEDLVWTAATRDAMKVAFMVGEVKSGTLFVDEVSLTEE